MVKKFTKVTIKKEYQDDGDNEFSWVAMSDEEKGRIDIAAFPCDCSIIPIQTVRVEWLEY
jgi:hypothetical protein